VQSQEHQARNPPSELTLLNPESEASPYFLYICQTMAFPPYHFHHLGDKQEE
jgi:hypothetical protein